MTVESRRQVAISYLQDAIQRVHDAESIIAGAKFCRPLSEDQYDDFEEKATAARSKISDLIQIARFDIKNG